VVRDVSLAFRPRQLHAVVGPPLSGKSTLLRTLNRMHEHTVGAWITGRVLLDGKDVYAPEVDPTALRRRIGMVLPHASVLPGLDPRGNIAAALPRGVDKARQALAVEQALTRAGVWAEVKDRLTTDPRPLSDGLRQRLCLARALAADPDVLLLDEPTAAIDPGNGFKFEEALYALRSELCLVLVTHDQRQAARIADTTTLLWLGAVVETAPSREFFTRPAQARTEAWLTGRSA
jgi:phosphate transport system ATP-binding protein